MALTTLYPGGEVDWNLRSTQFGLDAFHTEHDPSQIYLSLVFRHAVTQAYIGLYFYLNDYLPPGMSASGRFQVFDFGALPYFDNAAVGIVSDERQVLLSTTGKYFVRLPSAELRTLYDRSSNRKFDRYIGSATAELDGTFVTFQGETLPVEDDLELDDAAAKEKIAALLASGELFWMYAHSKDPARLSALIKPLWPKAR